MTHPHDARIDELKRLIDDERGYEGVAPRDDPYVNGLRSERYQLVHERWAELVATYGDPRLPGWPKNPLNRRGQPVAVDRVEIKEMLKLASLA